MYKILKTENKITVSAKDKNKEGNVIEYETSIRFIDLTKKHSGHPIRSYDAASEFAIKAEDKNYYISKKVFNFFNNEIKYGKELTKYINKNHINRTKLHKKLKISSETLRKLEEDPLKLDDRTKLYIRRKLREMGFNG